MKIRSRESAKAIRKVSGKVTGQKRLSRGLVSRSLETMIVAGFAFAVVYAASFTVRATQGVTKMRPVDVLHLRVQALNGCGQGGVAGRVADALTAKARAPLEVSVVDVDNFTVFDIERSFIISRESNLEDAQLLARQFGMSAEDIIYAPLEDNYRSIHVTVVVGRDYEELFLN